MTGRDLIIYILQNNLEDEEIFIDAKCLGFLDENDVAAKFEVGVETIRAWHELSMLPGFKIGKSIYFLKDVADPRERKRG